MKKASDSRSIRSGNQMLYVFLSIALSFLLTSAITSSIFIGAAFSTLAGVSTRQFLKQREERLQEQLAQVWPEVIDHLVSGLYSGLSISEALSNLAVRGPEITKKDFANFRDDLRSGTEFSLAISDLRAKFATHGSDQIFEALLLSKTLGGGELLNILRTLGAFQREDLALNKEIAIKHGWIKNSAHISAGAPWILLLIIGTQPGTAKSFATPTGVAILASGLVLTFVAYLWMAKLSALPQAPRVFKD